MYIVLKAVVKELFRLIFPKSTQIHGRVIYIENPTNLGDPCESYVHSIISNRFSSSNCFILYTEPFKKRFSTKQRSRGLLHVSLNNQLPLVFLHRLKVTTTNVVLFTRQNMHTGTKHFRLLVRST